MHVDVPVRHIFLTVVISSALVSCLDPVASNETGNMPETTTNGVTDPEKGNTDIQACDLIRSESDLQDSPDKIFANYNFPSILFNHPITADGVIEHKELDFENGALVDVLALTFDDNCEYDCKFELMVNKESHRATTLKVNYSHLDYREETSLFSNLVTAQPIEIITSLAKWAPTTLKITDQDGLYYYSARITSIAGEVFIDEDLADLGLGIGSMLAYGTTDCGCFSAFEITIGSGKNKSVLGNGATVRREINGNNYLVRHHATRSTNSEGDLASCGQYFNGESIEITVHRVVN